MDRLKAAMGNCRQTPSQTVLEHGISVWEHLELLIDHIANGTEVPAWWRVPAWCRTPGLLSRILPIETIRMYATWHDCVIGTPANASTDGTYRPSRLRVKTTMIITDADQDGSPDIRSMIMAASLMREMKPCGVEPDVTFNHEGGIHLSWTGKDWEIETGVERDGRFDWVCETQEGTISQSDGLIAPQDAVTTVQRLLAGVIQDDTMLLPDEGLAHV